MSRPFTYRPLQHPREIRVLRIAASPKIVLSLEHKNLDDLPLYTAISYTWGPEFPQQNLVIDGRVLRVRESVASMIAGLKDERYPRSVWIDAVCINQTSTDEQNHQVRLMGEIYSGANYVIAYLEGVSTHERVLRRFHISSKLEKWAQLVITRDLAELLFKDTTTPLNPDRMLRSRYFTRRWIIQEFCLARNIEFHFKGTTHTLAEVESLVQRNRGATSTSSVTSLCQLRKDMRTGAPTLEQLLYDHENAACSRYQDKIYALSSLTQQARLNLAVDYNLQSIELLLLVVHTCSLYENLSPFRVMSFVCLLHRQLEVSWNELYRRAQRGELGALPAGSMFTAHAVLRGVVMEHLDGGEQPASHLRSYVPPMATYTPINLSRLRTEQSTLSTNNEVTNAQQRTHVLFGGPDRHELGTSVSPNDQWPFTAWLNLGDSSTDTSRSCFGLCTVVTKTKDEVWQFPRTPLALVLRPTNVGYQIVGRAQLLKRDQVRRRTSMGHTNLETMLDWTMNDSTAAIGQLPIMKFKLTPSQVMQLLCWVNLDQCLRPPRPS